MNAPFSDSEFSQKRDEGGGIDFKRVMYHALRYWYVVVLSLLIAFTIAYFNNRYAVRIYPVNASIIIRETQETGGGEFLYKNALIDQYRNYLNEPYLIRSYPLIQRVLEDLNFGIVFYQEGNFMTTEAYDYIPVKAVLTKTNASYGATMIFKIIDQQSFSLENFNDEKDKDTKVFKFNDSIEYRGHHLIFSRIMDRAFNLYKGVPFLLAINDPRNLTSSYVGRLGVKWAEEGAAVINLSVVGEIPQKEIDFLNGLIAHYQEYDLNKKNQAAVRTIDFIKTQLTKISDSLKIFENQLERFKTRNKVTNLSEEGQRLYTKLEGVEDQKAVFLINENYYDYLEKYIQHGRNLDQVILPSAVGVNDAVLASMIGKMVDLQLEMKLFLGKEKTENPFTAGRIMRIDEIKNDILEGIKSLRATDKIKIEFYDKQIREIEKILAQFPLAERELVSIQRSYDLLENLYIFLMQKMSEAGISKASSTSDIVLVNPPMRGGLISPKSSQNYTISMIIGLLVPFAFFVLLEVFNNKIQSKEDIEKLTTIPFLGGVGHSSSVSNLIVADRPKSAVAESFRALRSNLNYFTGSQVKKVIMISSSISGEGKSFTTINLATVFAMSGRKTLIVGADMRKPRIYTDFGLTNTLGLSGYLSKINTLQQIIQVTNIENLDLVSGGPVPPNPSELLLNDQFGIFIKEALALYDYILIDTPPLALVTDAFVISPFVNHTLFVIRQNYTPKTFIRSVDEYYRTGKIKEVSVLLNDIYKSGLGYGYGAGYGYHYGYGYGYGVSKKRKNGHGYYEE